MTAGTDTRSYRLLGLGCGQAGGSAEILLKAALRAAEDAGAAVELVRLDDLRIPSGPDPAEPDDIWWYWEKLVECDGLVISTPIISRTVAARLKLLSDRLLGPNADAAIIEQLLDARGRGEDPPVPFRVDERVLRPRVAAFIAVGGSLTPQWKSLTLPVLHTNTLSMSIAVVDQVQFDGAGTPRSIVLDRAALERAAQLGRNVAAELGKPFDQAEYHGDPGACPMCHLDVVVLRGRDVDCATCGARGRLDERGEISWTDLTTSVISLDERRAHGREIQETGQRHAALRGEIERLAGPYDSYDRFVRPAGPAAPGAPPMAEQPTAPARR